MGDTIQEAKSVIAELEEKNRLQQQRIGQRDAFLNQLKEFGFDNLKEAVEALEILHAEHDKKMEEIETNLESARAILESN